MKRLLFAVLMLVTVVGASAQVSPKTQSPEDMYGMYDKDGKHREMTEKMEQVIQRSEEAKKEDQGKKVRILVVSLIIGLIPVVVVGGKVVRSQSWETNPRGTAGAMVIALAGGIALFAFNYGWFYLRFLHEEIFKLILSLAFILLLIGIGFYVSRKKK